MARFRSADVENKIFAQKFVCSAISVITKEDFSLLWKNVLQNRVAAALAWTQFLLHGTCARAILV
jgi:hypothetical protein